MNEKEKFLEDYSSWSTQSKFDDFKFIKRLSPQDKERLLNGSLVNGWAFLFGPFYYVYLGLYRSIFYIILSILFFTFSYHIGLTLYVLFALILSMRANYHYISFLKRKKDKYADFNPEAETPYFNISIKRLVTLSLLTGGIYLMYWIYQNAKVMRDYQKDVIRPLWHAIFMSFTSINVFRAIAYSVKSLGYEQKLKPLASAWFVFLLTAMYGFEYEGKEGVALTLEILTAVIVIYWTMIVLTIYIFIKYQKAINFYSKIKNIPVAKVTVWECVFVFIGCLLNAGLIYSTGILIYNYLLL